MHIIQFLPDKCIASAVFLIKGRFPNFVKFLFAFLFGSTWADKCWNNTASLFSSNGSMISFAINLLPFLSKEINLIQVQDKIVLRRKSNSTRGKVFGYAKRLVER